MAGKFLLLTGPEINRAAIVADRKDPDAFTVALETATATLLVDRSLPILSHEDRGFVLGHIFTPGRPGPLTAIPPGAWDGIISSRGRHLVDRYWGGYVAVLAQPGATVDVVRAPFGWLPCFTCSKGAVTALASDVGTLIAAGLLSPRLDRDALGRHLLLGDIRRDDTALTGLTELRGGDRLAIGENPARDTLWSPWIFAATERQLMDPKEAFKRLRDTALYCVRERTSAQGRPLLMMSGGLDSSVLAACLHGCGRQVTGFTFATDNPSGDERAPARRVTDHLGMALIADTSRVDDVDITRSYAARLPRPVARSFEQGVQALVRRAVAAVDATQVLNGSAGDNIFCTIVSPAPAADCLLVEQGRPHFWSTVRTVADLGQASVSTVAWRSWRRARSRRSYGRDPDKSFLSSIAASQAAAALRHPWLHAPPGIPPGKSVHVGLLALAQGFIEDFDPATTCPSDPVLISQPLIETCLRIPSWLWFDRGCNRAAARHAFAADLPPETVWRRSKGTPDSFVVQLLDANRPLIRTMLSDGVLASFGLLDVASIQAALDDPRPARGFAFARIMQLVDAEAWARGWPC